MQNESNKKMTEPEIPSYQVLATVYSGLHYECQRNEIDFDLSNASNYFPLFRLYKTVKEFFNYEDVSSIIKRHMDDFNNKVIQEKMNMEDADSDTTVEYNFFDLSNRFFFMRMLTTFLAEINDHENRISEGCIIPKHERKLLEKTLSK